MFNKKKIIATLLLIFSITLFSPSFIPFAGNIHTSEAASLNYKKIILCKGSNFKLKVSGTKRKVKWQSSNPQIVSVNKGKIKARKTGTAKIIAKIGKKSYTCTVKVLTKQKIASKLIDAYNWQCGDIWNDGYCDISHYVEDGTSSTGDPLNINRTMRKLKKALKQKKYYHNFVTQLQGSRYKEYKIIWKYLYPEMLKLEKCLKKGTPQPESDYDFPYYFYRDYLSDLSDEVTKFY